MDDDQQEVKHAEGVRGCCGAYREGAQRSVAISPSPPSLALPSRSDQDLGFEGIEACLTSCGLCR